MNCWEIIYKVSWIVLAILCAVCVVCMFKPKMRLMDSLQTKTADMREQKAQLEAGIRDFEEKRERFNNDPAFVEQTAREIGMVKTNEVLFKFTNQPYGAFP
jgi:cell division protein FtsB